MRSALAPTSMAATVLAAASASDEVVGLGSMVLLSWRNLRLLALSRTRNRAHGLADQRRRLFARGFVGDLPLGTPP